MAVIKVKIPDYLWQHYLDVTKRCGWDSQRLVEIAVLNQIQLLADEDLLAHTEAAARRSTKLKGKNVEEVIREYRREKARKAANGREKKASGGGP